MIDKNGKTISAADNVMYNGTTWTVFDYDEKGHGLVLHPTCNNPSTNYVQLTEEIALQCEVY